MPVKDKEIEKIYWGIGEVTSMLDVSHAALRYWEEEFDFIQPKKNKKGDRFYTKKEVEYIKMILFLTKEKGYTLKGVKQKLQDDGIKKTTNNFEAIQSLKKIREFLVELKKQI